MSRNKRSYQRIFLILNLVMLSACATGYHKMGITGGYSDMQLSKNMYRVIFRGNGYTQEEEVTANFYRRCAELTKENGYEYFVITTNQAKAEQYVVGEAKTVHNGTFTNTYGNGVAYNGTTTTEQPMVYTKHKREGIVVFFANGKQPQNAMNATSILSNFKTD